MAIRCYKDKRTVRGISPASMLRLFEEWFGSMLTLFRLPHYSSIPRRFGSSFADVKRDCAFARFIYICYILQHSTSRQNIMPRPLNGLVYSAHCNVRGSF